MHQPPEPADIDPVDTSSLCREHGHALKNIFSIIIANAEMIGEEGATSLLHRRLERIIEASRRGEHLVEQIRTSGKVQPTPTNAPVTGSASTGERLHGRVLVVDDEADVVEIIARYLGKEGLDIVGETDSLRALHRLQNGAETFDLVITDLDMPHCSGADLCRHLHAQFPLLPVIMITGYGRSVSQEEINLVGIRELLCKPLNRMQLIATIRRLLTV
jgi:CheY-like chemotaxis protein